MTRTISSELSSRVPFIAANSLNSSTVQICRSGSFGIEQPNDSLDLPGFGRQRSAGAFAGSVFDVPALGDQSEKSSPIPKRGFHGEMGQVMQRKERGLPIGLLLPSAAEPSARTQRSTPEPSAFLVI